MYTYYACLFCIPKVGGERTRGASISHFTLVPCTFGIVSSIVSGRTPVVLSVIYISSSGYREETKLWVVSLCYSRQCLDKRVRSPPLFVVECFG